MAIGAWLDLDGRPEDEGFTVSSFNFSFSQSIDQTGQPQGRVLGGVIYLSIVNLNDDDIFHWMYSKDATKDGQIMIALGMDENSATWQYIKFKGATLVNYQETYSEGSDVIASLTLSCKQLDISGAVYKTPLDSQGS